MTKLFVHNIWFRLFGPIFSGTLVYLLILLINDAVLFLQEDFLTQELWVCVGLAYLTQEFSRLLLVGFERLNWSKSLIFRMFFQLLGSMMLTVALVSMAIYVYFDKVLLYEPSSRELYVFNATFSCITLLYVVLYWAHYFLFKRNSIKLEQELLAKAAIEHDFSSYINGIHPELLFESLEAMLVLMKTNPTKAEDLADDFSAVYRYLLSNRRHEVVSLDEELNIIRSFIRLCNQLPHRNISLGQVSHKNGHILPSTLIRILEGIVRTTIPTNVDPLVIDIIEEEEALAITYMPEEKLQHQFTKDMLSFLEETYRYYSNLAITINEYDNRKEIKLPKLNIS
ncbi:MAG: histidine kinase [Croceivirga sp.]